MLVAHQTATVSLGEFLSMRIKVGNFVLFALFSSAGTWSFPPSGLYSSKRMSARWAEVFDVAKAATLGSGLILRRGDPLAHRMVTPFFILIFWAASTLAGAASRVRAPRPAGGSTPARPQPAPNRGGGHQSPRACVLPASSRRAPNSVTAFPASWMTPGWAWECSSKRAIRWSRTCPASRASSASRWWTKW